MKTQVNRRIHLSLPPLPKQMRAKPTTRTREVSCALPITQSIDNARTFVSELLPVRNAISLSLQREENLWKVGRNLVWEGWWQDPYILFICRASLTLPQEANRVLVDANWSWVAEPGSQNHPKESSLGILNPSIVSVSRLMSQWLSKPCS